MTQWTSVRLAKARVNDAKASMARVKAGQQGQQGQDKRKDKSKNKVRSSAGTVESVDTIQKTAGAIRTTKVVRKASTKPSNGRSQS